MSFRGWQVEEYLDERLVLGTGALYETETKNCELSKGKRQILRPDNTLHRNTVEDESGQIDIDLSISDIPS